MKKVRDVIKGKLVHENIFDDDTFDLIDSGVDELELICSCYKQECAEMIFKCVNMHDELVDELDSILAVLNLGLAQNGNGGLGRFKRSIEELLERCK